MFLDDRQELERHAAGLLGARLPLLDRALARVEIAGEDRLTHVEAFAKPLDLSWLDRGRRGEACFVESAHRRHVGHTSLMEGCGGRVNRLEGVTFKCPLPHHRRSP